MSNYLSLQVMLFCSGYIMLSYISIYAVIDYVFLIQSETDQISRYLNDNNISAKVSSTFLLLPLHGILCNPCHCM